MASLPALVSLEEFAARLGGIAAADEERAQAALDDASALIRVEAGTEDWVDDEGALETVPDVVVAVCVAVAGRAFRNPDGLRSEQIGTYSVTYGDATTAVYLTAAERRIVRRAAGMMSLGSIELESGYAPNIVTVPVDIGGDPIPWVTIGDETL